MDNLITNIEKVKDPATRKALTSIAEEINRIKSVSVVCEDTKQLAYAVNKITGKLQ